ncbi:hypothetical protein RclHR1_05500006 [Rhizophagus clarus]|uniref:Uncharacterized protein n=1 Tax=Rhizophagus clarus TaxID=94130 RepID=A0A2Z6RPA7_9GLOM|nr:hypothetical protein RclHR1_05500006 [Rhizophagus clarus]GES80868.1 hypothetical protein GLOIN_2v1712813 [Rhizophagus clarus]
MQFSRISFFLFLFTIFAIVNAVPSNDLQKRISCSFGDAGCKASCFNTNGCCCNTCNEQTCKDICDCNCSCFP